MIIDYIKRAFYKPNWKLAFREFNKEDSAIPALKTKKEYNTYIVNGDYWCADPFVWCEGDKVYVFCECYLNEKNKGTIAVGEYKNGKIDEMRIVIEEEYHMSYPCIFKYKSSFYMIPETSDNKTIELYRSKKFPYEWELTKILKKDIKCVDSTVFIKDNEIYVIGYILGTKKNKVCIFQMNMESGKLSILDEVEDDNTGRPAGNICYVGGKLIRPTQVFRKKYGESIVFKEIVSMKKNDYYEKTFSKLQGMDVLIKGEKKIDRIHTFNRGGNIEIIDFSHDTFDLARLVKFVLTKLRRIMS